ncbi:hypothetical protein Tco_1219417 [Tanacetum coccineum]
MIPLTTSLCITVPEDSPDMKGRSTSLSYRVSSMKVALLTPPFLMINLTFAATGFDCLLDINKKICPIFVLQFYKSVRITRVCVYTLEWPIYSLQNVVDSNLDIYPPPHDDSSLILDALFYERTQPKTRKMIVIETVLDPFQMIISELKTHLKKMGNHP